MLSANSFNVKTEYGVRVLAQSADTAEQKDLGLGDLACGESAKGDCHLDIQQGHLSTIDVETLDRVECTHLLIVATEDEDDGLLEETAAALATCYVELYRIVNVPFVVFDAVEFAASQLNFLRVLVTSECIDSLAAVGTHGAKEGLFLKHGGLLYDVFVNILQAIVPHATQEEP